jgi:hypothetical protein
MAQVSKVDDRGRIKLSKEIAKPGSSVVIIDARTYFLGIPIERDRVNASGSWLKSDLEIRRLKSISEEEANRDAVEKSRRRRHI